MGLIDDLKKWAHPYEDEDEEYEDDFAELGSRDTGAFADERPSRRERDRDEDRRNKVVNIHATTQLKVVLVKPERFENASEIADHLKEKRTVVINLESTNKDIARRLIDFLSGVAYAGEGKIKKVAANTYIITPYHVDIMGDLIDELENNGLYLEETEGCTMLTPQEVSNHAFAKAVMGGYNMAMVDEFLDELTDDYTSLYKENAALKAKMKVLVDKVEEYRSTEDAMRAALLTAQKMADSMVAEAEEKKKSLLENAESEANRKIGALRDEVAQEERRLTAAKAETADFLARVRELYEREMKLLEELPEADLAPAAPLELAKPAADVSEIEKSIMDSFKLPDLTKAAEVEPEAEEAPEEPEESPEEGNPFLDSATRAIKLSDLKFGRNYHGEE